VKNVFLLIIVTLSYKPERQSDIDIIFLLVNHRIAIQIPVDRLEFEGLQCLKKGKKRPVNGLIFYPKLYPEVTLTGIL